MAVTVNTKFLKDTNSRLILPFNFSLYREKTSEGDSWMIYYYCRLMYREFLLNCSSGCDGLGDGLLLVWIFEKFKYIASHNR